MEDLTFIHLNADPTILINQIEDLMNVKLPLARSPQSVRDATRFIAGRIRLARRTDAPGTRTTS